MELCEISRSSSRLCIQGIEYKFFILQTTQLLRIEAEKLQKTKQLLSNH